MNRPPRDVMEGVDDQTVLDWIDVDAQIAPVLFRGVNRMFDSHREVWEAARIGEPLRLSPWRYACATETYREAIDWTRMGDVYPDENAVGLLLVILGARGRRARDRDGEDFEEWLIAGEFEVIHKMTDPHLTVVVRSREAPMSR